MARCGVEYLDEPVLVHNRHAGRGGGRSALGRAVASTCLEHRHRTGRMGGISNRWVWKDVGVCTEGDVTGGVIRYTIYPMMRVNSQYCYYDCDVNESMKVISYEVVHTCFHQYCPSY